MNTAFFRTYLTVIDCGSFSQAEEKLFLSKQAIMQQMNQLEKDVGAPLLIRSRSGVVPTEAGKIFASAARKIISIENHSLTDIRKSFSQEHSLRLCAIDYHVLLDPVIVSFSQRYPSVQITKIFHSNTLEAQLVAQNIIDIGDTLYHPAYTQNGLRYLPLLKMNYMCILPFETDLKVFSLKDLADQPVLVHDREFQDYYSFHLRYLQTLLPQLEIISSRERRIDVITRAMQERKIVITASSFVRQIDNLIVRDLDIDLFQECGIVYRDNASDDVLHFVSIAQELYADPLI